MKRYRQTLLGYLKLRKRALDASLCGENIFVFGSDAGKVTPHNVSIIRSGTATGRVLWETPHLWVTKRCEIMPAYDAVELIDKRLRLLNPSKSFHRLLDYVNEHNRVPDKLSTVAGTTYGLSSMVRE